ncbi:MAG: hypothetical protein ACREB7_10740 [Sphingopyxis sp.]|uniref:hypothetical protein n=1 Tax=Sphingopyxis sp. TaxID=1908224 RepID=UPI003D6D6FD4
MFKATGGFIATSAVQESSSFDKARCRLGGVSRAGNQYLRQMLVVGLMAVMLIRHDGVASVYLASLDFAGA